MEGADAAEKHYEDVKTSTIALAGMIGAIRRFRADPALDGNLLPGE